MTAKATNKAPLLQWRSNTGASISELKISGEDLGLFSSFRLPALVPRQRKNKEYKQKTVTQIGSSAFKNCISLQGTLSPLTPPPSTSRAILCTFL